MSIERPSTGINPTLQIVNPKFPHGKTKNGRRKCSHGVHDYYCRKCPGKGICVHRKDKSSCRDCRGSRFCEHNKYRSNCKICKGGCICEHNKCRSWCKDCRGSQICIHNRQKYRCKDCVGGSICEHNKVRYGCKDCRRNLPLEIALTRYKDACLICGAKMTTPRQKFHGMCSDCISPNEKRPEIRWREMIEKIFEFKPSTIDENIYTENCNSGVYRPDLTFHIPDLIIVLELDEESHTRYGVECEIKRTVNMKDAFPDQKVLMIRMNPDVNNKVPIELSSLESRTCYMLEVMKQYLNVEGELFKELEDGLTNVIYLFYGVNGQKHISEAYKNSESVKVIDTHYC